LAAITGNEPRCFIQHSGGWGPSLGFDKDCRIACRKDEEGCNQEYFSNHGFIYTA
jgi:hypothetical protein